MTEQEKKQRIAIAAAFLRDGNKAKKEANAITEKFFSESIDPCYTIYEIFNRLRGAFDIVESMYNYSIITRDLCISLKKRINDRFTREMLELKKEENGKK